MKYNEVVENPTTDQIRAYVLGRLYFQGQPAKTYDSGTHHGPHRVRSAIGHLLPTKVLRQVDQNADPVDVIKWVRENHPELKPVFRNTNLIRKLEAVSRTTPEQGKFRSLVRQQTGFNGCS